MSGKDAWKFEVVWNWMVSINDVSHYDHCAVVVRSVSDPGSRKVFNLSHPRSEHLLVKFTHQFKIQSFHLDLLYELKYAAIAPVLVLEASMGGHSNQWPTSELWYSRLLSPRCKTLFEIADVASVESTRCNTEI